jgi:hypothetical protein
VITETSHGGACGARHGATVGQRGGPCKEKVECPLSWALGRLGAEIAADVSPGLVVFVERLSRAGVAAMAAMLVGLEEARPKPSRP